MNIFFFNYNILIITLMAGYFLINLLCVIVVWDLPWKAGGLCSLFPCCDSLANTDVHKHTLTVGVSGV